MDRRRNAGNMAFKDGKRITSAKDKIKKLMNLWLTAPRGVTPVN